MANGIFLSLSCGSATVYPVMKPFQPKPIRRGKATQAKELVDNSQLNDTIIAHIDSAFARASQNSSILRQRHRKKSCSRLPASALRCLSERDQA
jgi:hypothetical protein